MSRSEFPHDELEELIAADSLYGLSELEQRRMTQEMERHGPTCEECRRLVDDYAEVAARLALAAPPAAMSKGAEERLLQAIAQEGPDEAIAPAPHEIGPGRVRGVRRWISAAAVAAAIAVVAGTAGYLISPRAQRADGRLIAFLSRQGTRVVPFPDSDGQQLAVAFRPGESQGWVFGANLRTPGDEKVYELWYQPGPGAAMRPAGTFLPNGSGTVVATASVGDAFVALAVSVEPSGGSLQPTSDPIFVTGV